MTVTLSEAKEHMRIGDGVHDQMIMRLIDAAGDWMKSVGVAEVNLGRPAVRQAALILIGHWYDAASIIGDDSKSSTTIPDATMALIAPWREVLL